ncbi:MAG: hypothetical protein BM485_17620 [Desulfobulbaceae bacterium DB1]|nr:MAG: hypothetical protein BM485_17620 [Desulfobulbaceae bacterium DB1]
MAEIRSTLEMVLERAARLEAEASSAKFSGEEKEKEGMRLAASYMRGEEVDLVAALADAENEALTHIRKGMVAALLRNIFLPRDAAEQANANKAMQGLMALASGVAELAPVFPEMKSILDRYQSHKDQLKAQLEEQFAQQMAMMEKTLAQQTGMKMKLQPSQHPKFAEEWQRIKVELNEQYGRAVSQYKEYIGKLLSA